MSGARLYVPGPSGGDWLDVSAGVMHFRPNPRELAAWVDDFLGGRAEVADGLMGELNWDAVSGSWSKQQVSGRPGVLRGLTGALSGNAVLLRLQDSTPFSDSGELGPMNAKAWRTEFGLRFNQTTQRKVWFGLLELDGANAVNAGYGFRNVAAGAAVNWVALTRDSADSETDTGILADTSFHAFAIENNGSDSIAYYIDGTLVATKTTQIHAGNVGILVWLETSEAVAKSFDIDYFSLWVRLSR